MIDSFGYVVVRSPGFVGELAGNAPDILLDLEGESIFYAGIDRDPWWDFDDLFYAGKLAEKYLIERRKIIESKLFSFSPGVCCDLETAKEILELSNQSLHRNDLIMITALSPSATAGKQPLGADMLGFDCYVDGYGSLLRLGLFQRIELFNDFLPYLNPHGMFSNVDELSKYLDAYFQRCHEGGLEPITFETSSINSYLVSRPSLE
jgi:hypothetical protein